MVLVWCNILFIIFKVVNWLEFIFFFYVFTCPLQYFYTLPLVALINIMTLHLHISVLLLHFDLYLIKFNISPHNLATFFFFLPFYHYDILPPRVMEITKFPTSRICMIMIIQWKSQTVRYNFQMVDRYMASNRFPPSF